MVQRDWWVEGWGQGLSFPNERRNQEWSISRAARTFSRPRNNRSKARTELFIFQKIQDRRRPGRRRADFSFRKSFRPAAKGRRFATPAAGLQLFPKRKMPARGADRFSIHCALQGSCRACTNSCANRTSCVAQVLQTYCKHLIRGVSLGPRIRCLQYVCRMRTSFGALNGKLSKKMVYEMK